jgi:hypothetical protein
MAKNETPQTLNAAIVSLVNVVQEANHLVPGIVVVGVILAAAVIAIAILSVQLMVGIVLLLVLFFSIWVYTSTNNYGEAALALVAGLLTAFTVSWTPGTFIAFAVSWIAFSVAALFISSIKLAGRNQDIYLEAAQALDPSRFELVQKQLQEIAKDKSIRLLGPIKRAEVIRLFAFRKLPIDSISRGLKAVDILSTITRVDHLSVASFIADVYKIFPSSSESRYQNLLDRIYQVIRESPASPEEFIDAFRHSRRIALSGEMSPENYFRNLTEALQKGVAPEEVGEYIRVQI